MAAWQERKKHKYTRTCRMEMRESFAFLILGRENLGKNGEIEWLRVVKTVISGPARKGCIIFFFSYLFGRIGLFFPGDGDF